MTDAMLGLGLFSGILGLFVFFFLLLVAIVGNEAFSRRRAVGAGAAAPADGIAGLESFIALRASVHSTTSLSCRWGQR